MQHGQNRRCLQGCAVVAVQHRAYRLSMHSLGERRSPGQVSSVLGTVCIMYLEADDLAAVEVEDQVEVEPASLDLRRQERQILSANSGRCQCCKARDTRLGARHPRQPLRRAQDVHCGSGAGLL